MLDTVPPPMAPMPFAAQPASAEETFQRAIAHAEAVQGPEARDRLDAYWRARFQADPLLRMEFARAYAAYLAWLRNGADE